MIMVIFGEILLFDKNKLNLSKESSFLTSTFILYPMFVNDNKPSSGLFLDWSQILILTMAQRDGGFNKAQQTMFYITVITVAAILAIIIIEISSRSPEEKDENEDSESGKKSMRPNNPKKDN